VTVLGHPVVEILKYAETHPIDLIVIGTHGRGPLGHMVMGSTAERVVRKAPCPVLTVRHPEREFVVGDS
jgi:nucleotide-binding universal stress UspA family protein